MIDMTMTTPAATLRPVAFPSRSSAAVLGGGCVMSGELGTGFGPAELDRVGVRTTGTAGLGWTARGRVPAAASATHAQPAAAAARTTHNSIIAAKSAVVIAYRDAKDVPSAAPPRGNPR